MKLDAFRFRRNGENCTSAPSFFLSRAEPLRWALPGAPLRRSSLRSVSAEAAKTAHTLPPSSFFRENPFGRKRGLHWAFRGVYGAACATARGPS